MKAVGAARALWAATLVLAALPVAFTAQAQPQRDPGEIHGLKLGLKADEMSTDTFGDLACGSNGGPPRQAIDDWNGFRKCRPEPSGLHEVNVRFDDQLEYVGRAIDEPMYAQGRLAIINRYEPDGWNCTDLPPAPGETPVGGGVFVKQRCDKRTAARDLNVEA